MIPHRMRRVFSLALAVAVTATAARAQDSYKVEALKEGPPAAVAAALKGTLAAQGCRVLDDPGKPFAEFWLRTAVPASGPPAGPQGAVLFPILAEGELLGVLQFVQEGWDFRDQPIAPGIYTMRYGLQPVNGDHLGVSPFRDFALLLPAAQDTTVAPVTGDELNKQSAQAAGTNHPAVLMLLAAPGPASDGATIVHDEAQGTWGVVVPLGLEVQGQAGKPTLPVQLVVVGAAMM
jgi:hypothetical protein